MEKLRRLLIGNGRLFYLPDDAKEMHVKHKMVLLCLFLMMLCACVAGNRAASNPDDSGPVVADRLNQRYEDVRSSCEGQKAGYFCNGVLYRGINWSPDYYFYNNYHGDQDISFSYSRRDVGLRGAYRAQGFILKPAETWGKGGNLPLRMTCSYAFNAVSADRDRRGCGVNPRFAKETTPCAEQGIDSLEKYKSALADPPTNEQKLLKQCSLAPEAGPFEWSVLGRVGGLVLKPGEYPYWFWTEQLISDWPDNAAEQLPIEALFVDDNGRDMSDRLMQARAMRDDYRDASGRTLPIVRFNTTELSEAPFSYREGDQHGPALARPANYQMKGPGTPANYTSGP